MIPKDEVAIPLSEADREKSAAGETFSPSDSLAAIWERHYPSTLERIDLIERAVTALKVGNLGEELRVEARRAAHTLAGSVGTFGFARAYRAASELELAFEEPTQAQVPELSKLSVAIRSDLEGRTLASSPTVTVEATAEERPRVLIVDDDTELCVRVAAQADSLGIDCETAATPVQAHAMCSEHPPEVVLLDLTFPPDGMMGAYELLTELTSMTPPVPVLVLTGTGVFTDRVEVARRGGRAFLPKSLSPAEILEAATQFLARERLQTTSVLIVDDDPSILDAMSILLEQHEIEVSTLADPLRFWETLEEVAPELLILDVDMPEVNGPELCRVVRNDPRWSHIAVVFVTSHKDPETIEGVFQAGADDYLSKPIVGTELITRVSNRLDRVRLHRRQADTDSLTGLASRTKSTEGLTQLLSLAERFTQPVAVAMLDLDRFKQVNDTHGHSAGDAVLRALGERLRSDFRGDDVVGRWGGEECIVGMYGMTREDGVRRLGDTLGRFTEKAFTVDRDTFTVSFSAGVAQYPLDGPDLATILNAADKALYNAKDAGRSQVAGAGEQGSCDARSRPSASNESAVGPSYRPHPDRQRLKPSRTTDRSRRS